ncbi:protein SCARECROW-like [Ananas comosus]|uniref:Protein SCARECROW-like n=1 Tax=Ananas comosus TaxID=4615 RepID=A0A6P5ER59_ANACO|nr:protein SCARECROW-like [Ananas comosus]
MKSTKLVADSHTFPTKLGADSSSPPHHHHHHYHHHHQTTSPFPSTTFYYEPTSVLDPHLTSSPSSAAAAAGDLHRLAAPPPPQQQQQQQQQHPDSNSAAAAAAEWDPLSSWILSERDLALDLPQFQSQFTSFDPSPFSDPFETLTTPPFDRPHLELLLSAADSLESGDPHSADLALARLNPHLAAPLGPPLQRAAFYFKEALLSLLHGAPHAAAAPPPMISAAEVVRRIGAHKAFSDLSPVPQFASFTANQTLLEAFDAAGSAASVHVVDFDLGLGGQWSSFAHEVAARRAPQPPAIRVTAVVAEETPEAALAAENLSDFARGLGLRLSVDLVRLGGAVPPPRGASRGGARGRRGLRRRSGVAEARGGGGC